MHEINRAEVKIELPCYVKEIIRRLELCGYNAYIVGGCVRDALMGIIPCDYDITTDSTPDRTAACLAGYRLIPTGIKHGTLTAVTGSGNVEITTHRLDGVYSDNRRPDSVTFTLNLEVDLRRRDFTVNAMAYSDRAGIVDPHSGRLHIKEKIIKCVGDSGERFREDGLRILRALRFASVLGFAIDPQTERAMRCNRALLRNIPAERIFPELVKLLTGPDAGRVLSVYGEIIGEIIPDTQHLREIYDKAAPDIYVRLALLFCGLPYSQRVSAAEETLRGLRADNAAVRAVAELLENLDADIRPDRRSVNRLMARLPRERIGQLIAMRRALYGDDPVLDLTEELIQNTGPDVCLSLNQLAVRGGDLMEAGIKEGPDIGRILGRLLEMIIDGEIENDREELLSVALELNNTLYS
ncbi:MAG: tRNA nucleotidyltransferase [Eubacteriales bacterium]|jgi:tRNA nucleotidyltransferase (CCA-adding enzyme)|nr:tRNA nucleotidyltransferase [Eubacteriales bacterium]